MTTTHRFDAEKANDLLVAIQDKMTQDWTMKHTQACATSRVFTRTSFAAETHSVTQQILKLMSSVQIFSFYYPQS